MEAHIRLTEPCPGPVLFLSIGKRQLGPLQPVLSVPSNVLLSLGVNETEAPRWQPLPLPWGHWLWCWGSFEGPALRLEGGESVGPHCRAVDALRESGCDHDQASFFLPLDIFEDPSINFYAYFQVKCLFKKTSHASGIWRFLTLPDI